MRVIDAMRETIADINSASPSSERMEWGLTYRDACSMVIQTEKLHIR